MKRFKINIRLGHTGVWLLIFMLVVGIFVFVMGLHAVDTSFNLVNLGLEGDYAAFTGEFKSPVFVYNSGYQSIITGFLLTIFSLIGLGIIKWGKVT